MEPAGAFAYVILQILRRNLTVPTWSKSQHDPFKTLIMTIISQNTTDKNTIKAFNALSEKFEITPETLANAELSQIEICLRPAGLYKSKAKIISQVSKTIIADFHGTLAQILSLPLEEARKRLMQLHGVGPKTADVVLLFSAKQATIPVDTHVNRVAKRLGLAPEKGDYEIVRRSLQQLYSPKDYLTVHISFIEHGRKYCKARRPLCAKCPVSVYCPSRTEK
ncbi:MAG: endonuclease III [Candidatus Bathyarchaeia archaeon]